MRSSVTRLSARSRISADAFSSETSTDSTPSSFFRATLTAWAQKVQSMPSTLIRTCRSSADAGAGSNNASSASDASRVMVMSVSSVAARPEEVREVHAEPEPLVRLRAVHALVERKQGAGLEAVRLVQKKKRRADEGDASAGIRHHGAGVLRARRRVVHALDEEPEIRLRVIAPPCRRAVPVDHARRRDTPEPIAVARPRLLMADARP